MEGLQACSWPSPSGKCGHSSKVGGGMGIVSWKVSWKGSVARSTSAQTRGKQGRLKIRALLCSQTLVPCLHCGLNRCSFILAITISRIFPFIAPLFVSWLLGKLKSTTDAALRAPIPIKPTQHCFSPVLRELRSHIGPSPCRTDILHQCV